jgi:ABC-type uncharacterized transport system auxiliary subunit
MKWILPILFAVVFGGCTLTREVPPMQSYHLEGVERGAPVGGECGGRVIRVALVDAPQWLSGTDIYYSGADQKIYRYTRSRWEEPPTNQLQQIIENSLVASGLFAGVVPYQSLAKNDWLLEVRIGRMSQHIDHEKRGVTELKLYAVLIDRYSRRILAQKAFDYAHESAVGDARSAVDGWNKSVGTFSGELVQWLQRQCAEHPERDRSDVDL